jgi:AcrR family transcriptional regulator
VPETTRPYRSPRREQHAIQTRQDVLDAAREQFLAHGYARVTMSDIATAARTSVKTVYASVGTKTDVLHALLFADVGQSANARTVEEVRRAPDLWAAVSALAGGTRSDFERFRPSIDLLHSSTTGDEGARRIWDEIIAEYRLAIRRAAEHIVAAGLSAPGLDVDAVSDRLWFGFGMAAWRTLVVDCGWGYDDAERWLCRQAYLSLSAD